jgi:hypothetical protein
MMVNNELDVASVHRAFSRESNIVDRSTQIRARGGDWSKVKPLFPDIIEEGTALFQKHGYVPANHAYIIRGRHRPQISLAGVQSLQSACREQKSIGKKRFKDSIPSV